MSSNPLKPIQATPRKDVFDRGLDDYAVNLADVSLKTDKQGIFSNPKTFFDMTYITPTHITILSSIVTAFKNRTGKIIILPSTFGGGKSHTLTLIYHTFNSLDIAEKYIDKGKVDLESLKEKKGRIRVVVVDGTDSRTFPSPIEVLDTGSYKVKTLWGYIAHVIGNYELLREYDEIESPPTTDKLEELLRDKNVVFLFDEVIHRLSSWWRNERLENYAKSIVNFLLDFANAIVKTEAVLIFSIPADIKEREIKNVDKVYEEVIYTVYERLNRHDALIVPPMDIRTDVTQVLKKRIFENVDENTAREIANKYSQLAKHFSAFDDNFINNIVNTYPFNPNYLSTLLIITNRNTDIQKTRGLIKLTRVLVRWLWNQGLNKKISMISPSDFEISDPEIKPSLITPSFKEFDLVVQRVSESLRNLYGSNEKRLEIAKRIAYYILISTYVYKAGIRALGDFPTSREVIQAVYDMLLFDSLKARPNEIEDVLNQVSKDPLLKVNYIYTDDIHYWVTSMPGYEEYIAKLAGEIKDPEAWEEVKRITEDLVKEQLKKKESPRFYLYPAVYDLDLGEFDIPDEKKYTVVLALTRLPNFSDTYKLEKVILKDKSGNYRKYLNTVVLLYPNRSKREIEELENNIKRLIAYEKFRAEDVYPQSDKDLIDFINKKVKEARDNLEDKVIIDVQRFYNYVAFPDVGEGSQIRVTTHQIESSAESFVKVVEETLESVELNKVYSEMDFDRLSLVLDKTGKDITKDSITFGELTELFYKDYRLPMQTQQDIAKAILDGVKSLKVGVKKGDKIYFKKINANEGDGSFTLEPFDIIIPQREAAKLQMESLKAREETVGNKIIREYYVVEYGSEEHKIEDLLNMGDEGINIFIDGVLKEKREEIERGIYIKLDSDRIEVEKGQTVEVRGKVDGVGYEGEVEITAEGAEVSPSKGSIPLEFTVRLTADSDKEVRIEAGGGGLTAQSILSVKLKEVKEGTPIVAQRVYRSLDELQGNESVLSFTVTCKSFNGIKDFLNKLRRMSTEMSLTYKVEVSTDSKKVQLNAENLEIDKALGLISTTINYIGNMGANISAEVKVWFKNNTVTKEKLSSVLEQQILNNCSITNIICNT